MRAEFQKLRPSDFVIRTSLQIAICRDVRKFHDLLEEPGEFVRRVRLKGRSTCARLAAACMIAAIDSMIARYARM